MSGSKLSLKEHTKGEPASPRAQGFEPHERPYRWVMLVLLCLLYGAFGLVNRSIFPLVTPILRDLGISYTQMGFILGSWQLTYIFAALAAGSVLDKWGVRKSIFAGALIIGLSATLRHFATGFWTMLAAVALFGAGGPMISIGGPKTISEWFRGKSRGTAVGIYMTGLWIGGLVALSLTNSVVMPLTANSWRLSFVCYGSWTFAVALLWWFLARETQSTSASKGAGIIQVFRVLVRVRNVQILLVMALFSFGVTHGFTSWLPKILEASGMSATRAGFAASVPLAAGIPAILAGPRLVPPHLRGRFIAGVASLTAANIVTVVNASGGLLIASLVVMGFVSSLIFPLTLLILMDSPEIETRYMGAAGGMFFCVAEIGGFVGPLTMGALADITGSFLVGAIFLASLCLSISAMTLFLRLGSSSGSKTTS